MNNVLRIYGKCDKCKIGKSCLITDLNKKQIENFENIIKRKFILEKNSYLARPGDKEHSIYVIKSGGIKSYTLNSEGKQEIRNVYHPGDMIGFESICQENHLTFLQTIDSSLICEIPYHALETLCFSDPVLHRNFMKAMSQPLLNSLNLATILRKKRVESRLASYLLNLSERQGGNKVELPLSRKDTSIYLRTSEETLSRIMSKFRKNKVVEIQYDAICLKQISVLKKIANIPHEPIASEVLVQSI